jgi:Flp pilus assembly protein TadG
MMSVTCRLWRRICTRKRFELSARQRGAAAVEFAIIAPLFFMICFGMISSGITFNRQQGITAAVREGARYGATLPLGSSGATWVAAVNSVIVQAANGELDSTVTPAPVICIAVVSGDGTTVLAGYSTAGCTAPNFPFVDGGSGTQYRVEVVARRQSQINAILFSLNPTIDSRAVARYEEQTT